MRVLGPAAVLRAAAALAACAALAAGCGGGDGEDGPSGPDPNAILACAQDAGMKGVAVGADEGLGITGGVRLSVPAGPRIVVDLFETPQEAAAYSRDQGAFAAGGQGGGSSEAVGTAVIASSGDAPRELAIVRRCVASAERLEQ